MNKLQNESFKNTTEAGAANRLVGDDKIYITANPGGGVLNKTFFNAVEDGDLGSASISPVVSNTSINTYDMSATTTNTIIRHGADGGCMYQLPTASAGLKFYFINENVNPTEGTRPTVVLGDNDKIDFNRGGNNYTATLTANSYNHGPSGVSGTLGTEIKTQMEAADGSTTYTVSFDNIEKIYTVSGSASFYFKFLTGTNVAQTSRKLIGFAGVDGVDASSQSGMSLMNEVRVQPNSGDSINWGNKIAENPGYIALRKRGVMIAIVAVDSDVWEVEQVSGLDHIKNTSIGDNLREVVIVGRDSWVSKADGGTARFYLPGFSLNGYGYICDGNDGSPKSYVDQYNDSANTWTSKAGGGAARYGLAGFSLNGYGYICYGHDGSLYRSYVDQYNDSANTWTSKAGGGAARGYLTGFSLNGYGYICDGHDGSYTSYVDQYNDSANTWTSKAGGGVGRRGLTGFSLNGYGYIYGGDDGSLRSYVDQYN